MAVLLQGAQVSLSSEPGAIKEARIQSHLLDCRLMSAIRGNINRNVWPGPIDNESEVSPHHFNVKKIFHISCAWDNQMKFNNHSK